MNHSLPLQQQQKQFNRVGCGGPYGLGTRSHTPLKVGGSGCCHVFSNLNPTDQAKPFTLDLFHSSISSLPVEIDSSSPLPFDCQRLLDLKTGVIYYKKWFDPDPDRDHKYKGTMSRKGKNPKLDLRLNLSPPRVNSEEPNPTPTPSPPTSCVSSENSESNSPGTTSMILAGCPRCLMYVMLSEDDPKCPKCKSDVVVDFFHDIKNNKNKSNKN